MRAKCRKKGRAYASAACAARTWDEEEEEESRAQAMSSVSSCRPCARTSPKRVECAGTDPVKKMRVRLRVERAPAGKTQCAPSVGEVPPPPPWWW